MKCRILFLMTLMALGAACHDRRANPQPESAQLLRSSAPIPKESFLGSYYADPDFNQLIFERNEVGVHFSWSMEAPIADLPTDSFSVRWTGDFNFAQDGDYDFVARSDHGMRLLVDGNVLIDFATTPVTDPQTIRVPVKTGEHRIVAEYRDGSEQTFADLQWTAVSAPLPNPPQPAPVEVTPEVFLNGLKYGVNIERANAFLLGDFGTGLEAYRYLKSLGLTHVRLTYPFRPSVHMGFSAGLGVAPTKKEFSRILPSIHNANAVGLKVFLDLSDVIETPDMADKYKTMMDDYYAMAAKAVADENFDPNMVAVGIANEWGSGHGETNATFNSHRQRLLTSLRKQLPHHVLTTGPANWKHYDALMKPDFALSTDTRVIYDVHAYEDSASSKEHWVSVTEKLTKWSAEHGGAKVLFGEAGFAWNDYKKTELYYNSIVAMHPSALPLYPTFWAINDGNNWRMNKTKTDYHLAPELAWIVKYINGLQ